MRDTARERGKYKAAAPHRYSEDEIDHIARAYRNEEFRGAKPRVWDDVHVGESLPTLCKGPLTVTSVVAFVQGWGSLYVRAHGLAFDLFERHPALGIPNAFGVPEPPERVHWDEPFARTVGVPGAYDYGPERCSWLSHAVTNWIGDDAELRKLYTQIRRHNPEGDTLYIDGSVTKKFEKDGKKLVEFSLIGKNQDGELSIQGYATAELP